MMKPEQRNLNTNMDWNALDKYWVEQYEDDYGNLFYNFALNNHKINIATSHIESGLTVSA